MTTLTIGLSTCPNDTFLFAPLVAGRVDRRGLELSFELADVQELNQALSSGRLAVGKASFATALRLHDSFGVLPVGSALGFGVGPVLLGRPGGPALDALTAQGPDARVLCPGEGTTASLLLAALFPQLCGAARQVRFDAIMPALAAGEADAGVAIHEGRFTYQQHGLTLLDDLGARWERVTGSPVPLGGLLARLDLGPRVHATLAAVLADSLAAARSDPAACLPFMAHHAQELDDAVIWRHVELYVNEHTTNLGALGSRCLHELAARSGVGAAPTVLCGAD